MSDRMFDLTLSQAEELLGLKRTTFRNNVLPHLTQGYHYWIEKSGRYNIKFFSKARLLEWQQIGHDSKLLQDTIAAWHESLTPKRRAKRETTKSVADNGATISA